MTTPEHSNNKQWQLKAITEALGDLELPIDNKLTIGRGKDNDVVLGSKQVSRQHAELTVNNGTLQVTDLGSSNGTSVNDTKIEPNVAQTLNTGDVISFAVFSFRVDQKPVTTATQAPVVEPEVNTASTTTETVAPSTVETSTVEKQPAKTETVEQISEEKLEEALEAELEEPIAFGNPDQDSAHPGPVETLDDNADKSLVKKNVDGTNLSQHNKELAEEADPDVLRSKQAATAKLSATEEAHVEKTQADNKTFNTVRESEQHSVAHVKNSNAAPESTKKDGGSGILWVLLILLALGVAIWLFNSGALA